MDKLKNEIPDRAELTDDVQQMMCDNCFEEYLFKLKDKNHEFVIGLTDVLKCIEFAESEGAVPELPAEWWLSVKRHFRGLDV